MVWLPFPVVGGLWHCFTMFYPHSMSLSYPQVLHFSHRPHRPAVLSYGASISCITLRMHETSYRHAADESHKKKRGTAQDLPVLNAGNFQEWSIITTNNHPSNPQQPIHSLLSTSKKRIFRTDIKLETFTGGQRVWSLQPLAQFSNGCQMLENN